MSTWKSGWEGKSAAMESTRSAVDQKLVHKGS